MIRRLVAIVVVLALEFASSSRAADLGTLYDDATLEAKAAEYREVIQFNLNNVFLPRMTPAERRALAGLRIEYPLRGPNRSPFDFMAFRGARVLMPVMSIKFLADIVVAHAWLETNGYSGETVYEYLGMLKYQQPPGGRFPDPRTALQIPAKATDDPRVDQLSQLMLTDAITFILLHELGHVVHAHPGYAPDVPLAQARNNEAEADRFALEIMRRIGRVPTGVFYFLNAAWLSGPTRADFADEASYDGQLRRATHPLTTDRVAAVARFMRENAADFAKLETNVARATASVRATADRLDGIAQSLADHGVQRLIADRARAVTVPGLAPRRPGEVLAAPRASGPRATAATRPAFDGVYDGKVGAGRVELNVRFILHRDADRVTGRYSFGAGEFQITGRVEGDTMIFAWRSGDDRGFGRLRLDPDGGFAGSWGSGDDDEGEGMIRASRAP